MWNGSFFEKTTLAEIGAIMQLGHVGGVCECPFTAPHTLTVIHTNGIHNVRVSWCNCDYFTGGTPRRIQLLKAGLFPASTEYPNTAVSFDALDFYHLLTAQAKISLYDFFEALSRRVDNSGIYERRVRLVIPCHQFDQTSGCEVIGPLPRNGEVFQDVAVFDDAEKARPTTRG